MNVMRYKFLKFMCRHQTKVITFGTSNGILRMKSNRWILFFAKLSLISSLLVVLAGSVVRMTGSGMGCPDWPKCFGYLIPPTDAEQVTWRPDKSFQKGQMIVHNEALWSAKESFTTTSQYDQNNWEKYTRHDYATFNAAHTWTEYINRLVGAFTGLPVFITFVLSLFYFKRNWLIPVLAASVLFLLGFEAWLGKVVVDGNLVPHQITIHMFGALAIVAVLLLLIKKLNDQSLNWQLESKFRWLILGAAVLTLIQFLIGTGVREQVDILSKLGVLRGDILDGLPVVYTVHKSFSLFVLTVNALVLLKLFSNNKSWQLKLWLVVLLLEPTVGIGMAYLDFPTWMQPMHLMLAFLLFAVQFSVWLDTKRVSPSN